MERRQEDRVVSERVAIVETQMLQIGIMISRIEKDIHVLATQAKQDDNELAKRDSELSARVAELEKDKYKLLGGWVVLSAISMIMLALITLIEKLGVFK